jgi:shikimate kinase
VGFGGQGEERTGARRGVALVGFMGAGKSTVGRALADRVGWPMVDLDQILVERHGPIDAQIRGEGIAVFRARERAAALALCDGGLRVLATGGGTFEDAEVRDALRAAYRTVFLDVPLDVIAARLESGGRRTDQRTPLGVTSRENRGSLSGPAERALPGRMESGARRTGRPLWDEAVAERFARRRPQYALAELTVRVDGPPSAWVDEIAVALGC